MPEIVSNNRTDERGTIKRTRLEERALGGSPAVSRITHSAQEADAEFLSPISIGGQTVNLDFDTGSADTYVHLALGLPSFELT